MKRIMLFFVAIASIFLAMFILAPFAAPYGTYWGLDGSPAHIDHDWSISEFPYLLGDILCHQKAARSFVLNGSQMPVCIRDTGLLLGFALGCLAHLVADLKIGRKQIAIASAIVCFTIVEWAVEPYFGDLPITRFLTGVVSGAGVGIILGWLIRYEIEKN